MGVDVSVIIPAWRAETVIGRAVASVALSGWPAERVEILVEPDDGKSYDFLTEVSSQVRLGSLGPVGSGAGPARNRALARAQGRWITYLDADDEWEPGFLPPLIAAAEGGGLAFPGMRFCRGPEEVFRVGEGLTEVDCALFGRTGASMRPLVHWSRMEAFPAGLSQDVVHALILLGRIGGRAPLAPSVYRMNLGTESITGAADFSQRVHAAYLAYLEDFRRDAYGLGAAGNAAALAALEGKIALNRAYEAGGAGRHFYEFVAARGAAAVR